MEAHAGSTRTSTEPSAAALNFNFKSAPVFTSSLSPPSLVWPRPPATQELTFFPATGARVVGGRRDSANNNAVQAASSVDRHAVFFFSLCLHATSLSATVFYLNDSTNYETYVWPPFLNSLLQTDALISNYINLPVSSSPFFHHFLISHIFVSHFSSSLPF